MSVNLKSFSDFTYNLFILSNKSLSGNGFTISDFSLQIFN